MIEGGNDGGVVSYQPLLCRISEILSSVSFSISTIFVALALWMASVSDAMIDRLLEEFERALLDRLDALLDGGVPGQEDHLNIRTAAFDPLQRLETVNARHLEVEDHDVEVLIVNQLERVCPRVGGGHLHSSGAHSLGQGFDEFFLVVDKQYFFGHS